MMSKTPSAKAKAVENSFKTPQPSHKTPMNNNKSIPFSNLKSLDGKYSRTNGTSQLDNNQLIFSAARSSISAGEKDKAEMLKEMIETPDRASKMAKKLEVVVLDNFSKEDALDLLLSARLSKSAYKTIYNALKKKNYHGLPPYAVSYTHLTLPTKA